MFSVHQNELYSGISDANTHLVFNYFYQHLAKDHNYQNIDNITLILDWNGTKAFNEKLQTMIG